ncbi:hypothetical protein BC834DRAFT_146102 [Gloeopeniophorella convolvens]|nr:hypothetical protein BC834DRAFT_146102 [Gloeopeniophorella convolvens]
MKSMHVCARRLSLRSQSWVEGSSVVYAGAEGPADPLSSDFPKPQHRPLIMASSHRDVESLGQPPQVYSMDYSPVSYKEGPRSTNASSGPNSKEPTTTSPAMAQDKDLRNTLRNLRSHGAQHRTTTADSELPSEHAPDGFSDPSSQMWTLYLSQAENYDKEFGESLKGDMEGLLVFTGLFSAALATFLVESYQNLSPPANTPQQSAENFTPSSSAVRVNVFWFLSLVLNLICALVATLVQQWSRRYQQLTRRRSTPHKRGRVRAFLHRGIERSQLTCVVEGMIIAIHASVGLFLIGLFDFLRPINKTVAFAVLGLEAAFAVAYCAVTFAPSISLDLPYITPLSSAVWRLSQAATTSYLKLSDVIWSGQGEVVKLHETRLKEGLEDSVLSSAIRASPDIDKEALGWLLGELDEDHEVDSFISSIQASSTRRL